MNKIEKKKKNCIEEYYSQGKETANEKVKTINKIDDMLNGDKYIEEIHTMHILIWHFKISFSLKYFLHVIVIFFN